MAVNILSDNGLIWLPNLTNVRECVEQNIKQLESVFEVEFQSRSTVLLTNPLYLVSGTQKVESYMSEHDYKVSDMLDVSYPCVLLTKRGS